MSLRQHEIEQILKFAGYEVEPNDVELISYETIVEIIRIAYSFGFTDANGGEHPPMIPEGSTRCAPQNFKA